ncbi:hypothetical protein [Caminibacter pacificus]|uniref:Uncharacterized protein n=1 Tax=Caminibacter pacificus TaxID=1424653 RepID=A0AAJ4RB22_9BACT|nr:hypothetical protein [Caminibacter pacificus]QDD68193.1 hypothetical protein C6V80_10080 [Caminibacter pacificus]ROR38706.1 hypothetical protein EDC58_1921 [Caminibacter pacificus]
MKWKKTCKACIYYAYKKQGRRFFNVCTLFNKRLLSETEDICENFKQERIKINKQEAETLRRIVAFAKAYGTIYTTMLTDINMAEVVKEAEQIKNDKEAEKKVKKYMKKLTKIGFLTRPKRARTLMDYYAVWYELIRSK